MKLTVRTAALFIAAAMLLTPLACSSNDVNADDDAAGAPGDPSVTIDAPGEAPTTTIVRTLTDQLGDIGEFSILVELLDASGLATELPGGPPYTLLAPEDAAFAAVSPDRLATLRSDPDALRAFLLGHVIDGSVPAAILPNLNGQTLRTRLGTTLRVEVDDQSVRLVDSSDARIGVLPGGLSGPTGIVVVVDGMVSDQR